MRIVLNLDEAKELLSRALNAKFGGRSFEVTDVEWKQYTSEVSFELQEATAPVEPPDYIPVVVSDAEIPF